MIRSIKKGAFMKYAYFPTWYYITYPTVWASYKVPIYTCDRLYNQTPAHGAADTILAEGRDTGYSTISEFYKDVCDVLTFNPFAMTKFYVTSDAADTAEFVNVINSFTGTYEERNGSYNGYNPEPDGTGSLAEDLIGYCDLSTGIRGSNAFTGPYFSGGGMFLSRILQYSQFATNDGIEYDFQIWPESAIENGAIDLSHLFNYEGKYRLLITKLFIYLKDDKYYWYVKLSNYTCSQIETDWMDNHLDGYQLDHIYEPSNPYDNKQADGNEGGGGGFDNDSDPNEVPPLPTIDVTALGGIKLYKCTAADISTVFGYLNSNAPGDSILKWFNNPIQGFVSCYYLPYPVESGSAANITILGMDTGAAAVTAKPWTEYSLGSMYVDTAEGDNFLDYAPYSKASIYLPFIGVRSLDIDEIVKKTVGITYQFDNISGACVAFITINNSVRYTYSGSCAVGIPISQSNWGQFYISAATAAAGALAGGIGAAGTAIAQGSGMAGAAMEGLMGAVQGGGGLNSLSAKPSVSRSGALCGAASALGMNKPFLILQRPVKAKVANPAPVTGLACGRTLSLGSLSGYNIIEHVHLDNIPATGPELDEIERLLYQGAIF